MQLLSYLVLSLRRWQRYGNVRRELAAYSDRELNDMGLRRSDIPAVARAAAAQIDLRPNNVVPAHFANAVHSPAE